MMNASPGAMSAPIAAMMAAAQAGKAPICSGNTTCCATTSPRAFINAQDASCDSRTMVEKPVRNSEFCISCTMPERLALTTSSSIASMARIRSTFLRHDQVLPFVHPGDLAGSNHRRAIELFEDGRAGKRRADVELAAPVDWAIAVGAVEAHAAAAAPGILECSAGAREFRQFDRCQETDAAHAVSDDFDRLLRRHMAEHTPVLLIEAEAQRLELAEPQGSGSAGHGDLVPLSGVAHIERPFDANIVAREPVAAQVRKRLRRQRIEDAIHLVGANVAQRRQLRADVIVLDVRQEQADRRKHSGLERYENPC